MENIFKFMNFRFKKMLLTLQNRGNRSKGFGPNRNCSISNGTNDIKSKMNLFERR